MKPLKALLVEDSNDDAALLLRHLSNEGYDVQSEIVQTSADLKAALAERDWDIILSDYTMPHFTGLDALRVLKKSNQDIPLIIISGTIGEDIAVEAMLDGANDYLMKGNLTRLAPAIERDLENAARRRKQKQAEDALRRSEELLANAQRIAHIGSWETDLVNNHLYWSDEVYRIFGVSKNEFGATLESFVNFIHPEDRQSVQAAADAAISGNAPYNIEHRIVRSDGEERIVCEIGEVTFDESGKPLRFTGTVQDVTGRKLIEAALENAAKRERAMIENALDVICTIDAEGKFASVSPASLGVWGYQPEELVGHPYIELVAPEDVAKTNQAAAEIMSGVAARDFENRYRHKNGSMVDIRWTAFWSDTEQMMFCVAHDITERKRAEEEKMLLAAQLEQQHERLNNIIDNVAGVVWEAYGKPDEATQKIDFISDYVETMLGYTVEEWLGTPNFWLSIVHPDDRERMARVAAENFLKSQNFAEEFRWVAKDGRIVWVETHSTVICDKSGQPIGYRGVNIDITERKRLEEERALLISELDSEKARLQHIFDNSPSFIVTLRGPDFVFEMANPAYYKLIGNRELIGFPAAEALPELATQDLPDILNHVYATGEPFFGNEMAVELQSSKNSPPTKHYINFVYMPLRDADNSISGIISYGMDVTEQVFSRFLIQESEERYRFLFENNPLPMWVFDLETLAFLSVNQAAIDHYGYSRKEFLSMSVKDIRPPEEIPSFLENVENDSPGIRKRGIFRHRKKDGTEIFVEKISNQIIFNGKTARLVLANDITERRKAEESIQFQAHLLNTVEQAIIATDLEGIVCYWNQFAEKLYGWTSAEVIGRNIKELTTPEINSLQASQIMTQLSTGKSWSGEFQVQNRNGDVFPVYISNSPIIDNDGKLTGIVGVSIDISERKQNEEILKQSERDYRTVFEQAHDAILIFAPEDEIILEVNERACEIYGFNRSEFIGMSIDTISKTPDYDREKVKKTLESREYFNFETVQYRKDGSEMFLEVNASKINYQGKQAIITINRDISERKLSEEALRQAEDKYRRLVELSPAIVYLAEPHPPFSTIYVSPNITRFGYSLEEWLVRADMWVSIIHKQDRARVIRATEEAIESGSETDLEYRVIARDGAIFWLHDKGRFIVDENGRKNGWQGVMVDITRTKELEEQLRQAQKLESVGLLAGGIAHDFNNMLTAINGYSDLTLRRLKPDDPLRLNIEEIKKAGQRSADLTQQLLAFSRQQMLQPVVLDLNDIISDTIKMLKRVIGEDIQLTTILNSKIGRVKVDPGQFSQIFMNLAVNARDSMPNGGKLTIETSNVFLDPDYARRHIGVLPGAYVMLSVSDTGIGMSDETKKHIFEPFFTTKEIGKGTGLGLATVYGIVKQSGGSIEVYSEQSVGTTFKVYLPRVAEQKTIEKINEVSAQMPTGTETILLVEDEEMVRRLTKQILEECGYTVIEAGNGLEALKICEQSDFSFDLLMTDVVMPEIGGRELSEILKSKLPDLRVLFTSGYTDDAIVRHGVIEINSNFIQKPFSPEMLASKVREILDNS